MDIGSQGRVGSHLRLTRTVGGEQHHITIPAHATLRVGTLSSILSEVACHMKIDREQLARELFGAWINLVRYRPA
jgi:hypothetical protein